LDKQEGWIMATAKQLKLYETVARRQGKLLICDENVCGGFVKRQLTAVCSEPAMQADEEEENKV
jgi:meiotically up-regulated gene 157 (Mug157) protein